jgi:hypothetical protein
MKPSLAIQIALGVTLCAALLAPHRAESSDATWLLSYAGKTANNVIWDKRTPALLSELVPPVLLTKVSDSLSGPPDAVQVVDDRYVSFSACYPHWGYQRAFLWVDTATGAALSAYTYADAVAMPPLVGQRQYDVTLASKAFSSEQIPTPAEHALRAWFAAKNILPTTVRFVEPSGAVTTLDSWSQSPARTASSLPGNKATNVRFTNLMKIPVEVSWKDFQGDERLYRTLQPGEKYLQPTFVSHVWVVRNALTHELVASLIAASDQQTFFVSDSQSILDATESR